ncbi:DODA-type extradiol aromatic ring-opening family dioxygenase [Solimonas sp. K1W22B-7]|uniref:DODA-type extradiol aromatic ring-opening family dioxygenase n=1 Tax=Solimonas sp. K1W22B-7 TaxID=2303331 RepID=UPI001F096C83|nr:class III extradiol ring-cleavage dioxygenase [Solimonas sp. K1W22B-7]
MNNPRLPSLFLPHGGGPCFFMDWDPPHFWNHLGDWLRALPGLLPAPPRALLVISAHWETPVPTVTSGTQPALIYDYGGFPPHTYQLKWPAPGDPALAQRVQDLLAAADIASAANPQRGFDHGVFVPLLLAYPQAQIPTVQLSLRADLDAAAHLAIGRALAPLRDEGVLILGSGFSYHNLRAMGGGVPDVAGSSRRFDDWLTAAVETRDVAEREHLLAAWTGAPDARACHPRPEHLIPLMVAAGAGGDDPGTRCYHHFLGEVTHSGFRFG